MPASQNVIGLGYRANWMLSLLSGGCQVGHYQDLAGSPQVGSTPKSGSDWILLKFVKYFPNICMIS